MKKILKNRVFLFFVILAGILLVMFFIFSQFLEPDAEKEFFSPNNLHSIKVTLNKEDSQGAEQDRYDFRIDNPALDVASSLFYVQSEFQLQEFPAMDITWVDDLHAAIIMKCNNKGPEYCERLKKSFFSNNRMLGANSTSVHVTLGFDDGTPVRSINEIANH